MPIKNNVLLITYEYFRYLLPGLSKYFGWLVGRIRIWTFEAQKLIDPAVKIHQMHSIKPDVLRTEYLLSRIYL